MLQWGHGLAAVDGGAGGAVAAARQWASMGPRPCGRGRGRGASCRHFPRLASMGPRPCGRGRFVGHAQVHAQALLQWSYGLAAVDGDFVLADLLMYVVLQWGHGLAAVDGGAPKGARPTTNGFNGATALRPWTARSCVPRSIDQLASMGPRPCGRGRRQIRRGRGERFQASMGPRPCGRGRMVKFSNEMIAYKLQWGHGLAAVDGARL